MDVNSQERLVCTRAAHATIVMYMDVNGPYIVKYGGEFRWAKGKTIGLGGVSSRNWNNVYNTGVTLVISRSDGLYLYK